VCICVPALDQALLMALRSSCTVAATITGYGYNTNSGLTSDINMNMIVFTKQEAATTPQLRIQYHIWYVSCKYCVYICMNDLYEQSMNKSSLHYCYHCGFEHTHFQNTTNHFQNNISTLQICSAEPKLCEDAFSAVYFSSHSYPQSS